MDSFLRTLLVITFLTFSACQHRGSLQRSPGSTEAALEALEGASDGMALFSIDPQQASCAADQAGAASRTAHFSPSACERMMQRIYANGNADVRLAFGYLDTRPGDPTYDVSYRKTLADELLKPCSRTNPSKVLCGFVSDRSLPDRLTKRLDNGWSVSVTLTDSSVTASDDKNRLDERQKPKTEKRNTEFVDSLKRGDAVLYIGHSRDGGGPDFGPPRLRADKHVDYDWYQRNRPGLKRLVAALGEDARSTDPLDLYASLSCSSVMHFKRKVDAAAPGTGYIGTSRAATFGEVQRMARLALEKIITRDCKVDAAMTQGNLPGQFFPR